MKSLNKLTLIVLLVLASLFSQAQYCIDGLNDIGSGLFDITVVSITGTTLNNTTNHPQIVSGTNSYYSLLSATGSLTGTVLIGSTYTFGVTTNSDDIISIWIDYDQDNLFETTEWTQVTISSGAASKSVSITIPSSATSGQTRMRIRTRAAGSPNDATSACIQMLSGCTEDYVITIQSPSPAIPVANFSASSTLPLTGQPVTFTDITSGVPTSWDWSFTGGTPSTSNLQHPTVTYSTAGTYPVTLTATNGLGSDVETKTNYIVVENGIISETFSNAWTTCNAPNGWTSEDACGSTDAWHQYGTTTGWVTGNSSPTTTGFDDAYFARFHSYDIASGNTSDLISGVYDLSNYATATLSFYSINPSGTDNVKVYVSSDGGVTWSSSLYTTTLSSSWTYNIVTIGNSYLSSNFKIKFTGTSDYGYDDIGIDRVLLTTIPYTGIPPSKLKITSINNGTEVLNGTGFSILVATLDSTNFPSKVLINTLFNLSVATGTGSLSGTISGTILAGTSNCTVTGIIYNKNETNVSITATRATGDVLSSATSSTFTVKKVEFTENFSTAWASCNAPNSWTSSVACGATTAWHRNDITVNWTSPTGGNPIATGSDGGNYARFHTAGIASAAYTDLISPSLNLACNASVALSFYYINTSGTDGLKLYYSKDNGTTWTLYTSYTTATTWTQKTVTLSSSYLSSTFKFQFRGTSDAGTTDIGVDQITIIGTPATPTTPTITSSNSICNGSSLTLTSSSKATYLWSTGATTSSITVSPTINTTYSVTTTDVVGCSNTASNSKTAYVTDPSSFNATITADDVTTFCKSDSVGLHAQITGNDLNVFNESFETGNFTNHSWTQGGTLPWTIVSTGQYDGAFAIKSGAITHSQTSEISVTKNIPTYTSISFYYKASTSDNLYFYIDGILQGSYTGQTAWTKVTYNVTPGTKTFKWTYSKNAGTSTYNDCVWIDKILINTVSYQWLLNGTAISGATDSIYKAKSIGNYSLVATYFNTCKDTSSLTTVTVNPVFTVSALPDTICYGSTTSISATGATSYIWNTTATTSTITSSPVQTTTYTVTANYTGCTDTKSVAVTVKASPIISGKTTICKGATSSLSASSGTKYQWSTGDSVSIIYIKPDTTTTYSLTVTNGSNCSASSQVVVKVYTSSIVAEAGTDKTVNYGNSVTLNASGGSLYQWKVENTGTLWHFINSLDNWTSLFRLTAATSTTNLNLTVTGADPYMFSADNINLNASTNSTIIVRMKNNTSGVKAKFYWITTSDITWNETKSQEFWINPNELDWTTHTINMSDNSAWTGTIRRLRFDVTDDASSGTINLDYIKIPNYTTVSSIASPSVIPLKTTNYKVFVTDSTACTSSDSVKVFVTTECSPAITHNAILNGNFESGNTGFTSGMTHFGPVASNCVSNCTSFQNYYTIGTNAEQLCKGCNMNTIKDHTSGTGNAMYVDGPDASGSIVWQQTVNVYANQSYNFSFWYTLLIVTYPQLLEVSINGVALGSPLDLAIGTSGWQLANIGSWNSASNTTADIVIKTARTIVNPTGNDFAIDDISFANGIVLNYSDITDKPDLGESVSLCLSPGNIILDSKQSTGTGSFYWYKENPSDPDNQTLLIDSSSTQTTLNVTTSGLYRVCYENGKQYAVSSFVNVSNTIAGTSQTLDLCSPAIATLNPNIVGPNINYVWSTPSVVPNPGNVATFSTSIPGTYTVTITNSTIAGCIDTVTSTVTSSLAPYDLTKLTSKFNKDSTVTITGLGIGADASAYKWYNAASGGTLLGIGASPTFTMPSSGNYYTVYIDDTTVTTLSGSPLYNSTLSQWGTNLTPQKLDVVISQKIKIESFIIKQQTWTGSCTGSGTAPVIFEILDNNNTVLNTFNMQVGCGAETTINFTGLVLEPGNYKFSLRGGTGNTAGTFASTGNTTFAPVSIAGYFAITAYNQSGAFNGPFAKIAVSKAGTGCSRAPVNLPLRQPCTPLNLIITGTPKVCTGSDISLSCTNNGMKSYTWSGPLGYTSAVQNLSITSVTSASDGTYQLIATDNDDCVDTTTYTVVVNETPTVNAGTDDTICKNETANLVATGTSGSAYAWSEGTNAASASVTPATTTSYTVTATLTYTGNTCIGTDQLILTVKPLPTVNAGTDEVIVTGNSATLSAQGGNAYEWNTGETIASITKSPTATTTYTVTATENGCTASDAVVVNVTGPGLSALAVSDKSTICNGNTVLLTANEAGGTGPYTYSWSGGGTSQTKSVTPTISTTYTITITDNVSATATSSVAITVNQLPIVNVGSNSPICVGATLNLFGNASPATSYNWSGPSSFTSNLQNATRTSVTSAMAGTYIFTATDDNLCNNTFTLNVMINALPIVTVTANTPCAEKTLNLTCVSGTATSYNWAGPSSFTSTIMNPSRTSSTTAMSGIYTVTVADANTCINTADVTAVINSLPTVNVSATSLCEESLLKLTNSSNATSFEWAGPNAYTSTLKSPTISSSAVLTMAGTYSITVTDDNSCSNTTDVLVTINVLPTVSANSNSPVCAANKLNLSATSGTAISYNWAGPSDFITVVQNPSIDSAIENMSGIYTVTITDANSCSNKAEIIAIINTTASSNNQQTICDGGSYIFNGHTYTIAGNYNDTLSTINGCDSIITTQLTVNPIPTADAGSDIAICPSGSTTLTATGGDTYNWSTTEATAAITVAPTTNTTYTVTVTNNGCSATDEATVTVIKTPITVTGDTICSGEIATVNAGGGADSYVWSNGVNSTDSSSIHVFPTVNTSYTVTITLMGCTASGTANVLVNAKPVAVLDKSTANICTGETISFTASGGTAYIWSTGAVVDNIVVNPTINSTYTVTVTNTNGCTATDDVIVSVNPIPTANAGADQSITNGQSANLTAIGGSTYNWSNGITTAINTVTPTATTTYTVTVTSQGCSATDDIVITVTSNVIADAGSDVDICKGNSTTLTAKGGGTYNWNTNENTASINVSPTITTSYTVTVTNNGLTATDDVVVTVNSTTADAGNDVVICVDASTTLSVQSSGGTYEWSTTEATAVITVSPTTNSTYTVTVTNNGCSATDNVVVTLKPVTTANAGDDIAICQSAKTMINATGGDTYTWSNLETTSAILVNPATTITYTVTVSNNGCTASDNIAVTVKPLPTAIAGASIAICEGASTTLTAQGGTAYQWKNGPATDEYIVTPDFTSTYTVIVSNNGCTNSDDVIVTVKPLPTVNAGADAAICKGGSAVLNAQSNALLFAWSTTETTNSVTVNPVVNSTYTVTASYNGCSNSDEVAVTIQIPVADAGLDKVITEGHSVTLSAAAGAKTYSWSTGKTTEEITVSPVVKTTYSLTVTDTKGCTNTDDVIVDVSPCAKPVVKSINTSYSVCENNAIDIEMVYTGDNVKFQWTNANQQIVSLTNSIHIDTATLADAGVYYCSLTNVCGDTTTLTTLDVNELPVADITIAGNASFCQGDSTTLISTIGDNYTYQWMKNDILISSATTAYLTAKTTGSYSVKITNAITGCTNTSSKKAIIVNSTDFKVSYTTSTPLITSTPFTAQLSNTTPNATEYNFKWTFGDTKNSISNNTNVIHEYAFNGAYDISLTATNKFTGCASTQYDSAYIYCMANGNDDPCDTKIKIVRTGSNKICVGDSVLLTANVPLNATCQWTLNDEILPEGINKTLYAKEGGEYSVTADWNDCSVSANATKISTYPKVTPAITASGELNACLKNNIELKVTTFFKAYSWSTSESTYAIAVNATGTYSVTTTDLFGCKFSAVPFVLTTTKKAAPAICIVSVDYVSKKNMIIWEKENNSSIVSYNIYGEPTQTNVFEKIGTVLAKKLSQFIDTTSKPAVRSHSYKITTVDSCGLESELSSHHRTLHLGVTKNTQGAGYFLNWDDTYEGFDYNMYYILRSFDNGDFVKIDSIPSNLKSYTDPTTLKGKLFYTIAAVKPGYFCNPTGDSKGVLPIEFKGASYSNVSDEMGVADGIDDVENTVFQMYPNPAHNSLTINTGAVTSSNPDYSIAVYRDASELQITNALGQTVFSQQLNNSTSQHLNINISQLADGVYFVKLNTGIAVVVQKFVKR